MKGTIQRIDIPKELKGVRTVRLSVEEGDGNTIGALEIEVYTNNITDLDPTVLFTDATCSKLKDGITKKDIESFPYEYFRNIARHMMNDTYQREFRIEEYKAYQHPSVQSRENKTTAQSLLDNPTGISVEQGESLVVMVGDTHGENISLRVVDWDGESKKVDGWGHYNTYMLNPGLNRFDNVPRGLVYVMYHTDNFKTAKPVKIHIVSGKINGLYDSSKHRPEQWDNLLNSAIDKHFDVVGKYAHIIFPTSNLFSINDGQVWIDNYDLMVLEQQKFIGLEKYKKMFNNRHQFNVMYSDSYMYSAGNHTAYSKGTIAGLCEPDAAFSWGPAHEVGHSMQTSPGMKWHGLTEVTNNILSRHIQYSYLTKDIYRPDRYRTALNDVLVHKRPFINVGNGDVFCRLVPFWSLELYMNYVLGKEDFYKDIYEAVRIETNKNSAAQSGEIQLDFAYKACVSSGLDLTDYFEKWGWFRSVNVEVSDYGDAQYIVTDDYARKIKEEIAALGLPKPKHNFEYITELTVDIYKKSASVKRGSLKKEGNSYTFAGWDNAVAYEIYNNANDLLYVSIEPEFKAEFINGPASARVVAADGTRMTASF